jgi:hypothetical protein
MNDNCNVSLGAKCTSFLSARLSKAIDHTDSRPAILLRYYSKMATTLAPLPQPGFTIFQGFTATKPESFLAKDLDTFGNRSSCSILFCSPEGEPGAQFLEIVEGPKNYISFRITNGQEVMRILKKASAWQFKTNEYTGLRVDGTEVWHLKLKKGWLGSDYGMFLEFLVLEHDGLAC